MKTASLRLLEVLVVRVNVCPPDGGTSPQKQDVVGNLSFFCEIFFGGWTVKVWPLPGLHPHVPLVSM
jgi:hypothetical protein